MRETAKNAAVATVICCALCAICEGIDLQSAGVAAAGIRAEFHPSPDQLRNFLSFSTLGLFFGALIGGRLADAYGRKPVLIASTLWYGVGSLLTTVPPNMEWMLLVRFATGVGFGGALPNLVALVSESVSEHRRKASVTLVYAAMPFGGTFASLISLFTSVSQWRWVFIAGGLAPVLIVPVMLVVLKESPAYRAAKAGSAHAVATIAEKSSRLVAMFSEGRAARTVLLWISFFLGLLTLYLMLSWLPTLLQAGGLSKSVAGTAQVGFNLGGAIAALVIGLLLEGRTRTPSLIVTFVSMPILMLALSQVSTEVTATVIVVFLLGAAILAGQAFLYAMAPSCYPTLLRGTGVGVAVAMGRIGSIVGPQLGGLLQKAGQTPPQLLLSMLPIVVAGCITSLILAWMLYRTGGHMAAPVSEG